VALCTLNCKSHRKLAFSVCSCMTLSSDRCIRRTDIEQEANGLYSFNRKEKIEAGRVKSIMEAARAAYFGLHDDVRR
jgi:hypothetical protein